MPTITIDGKEIEVAPGTRLIDAAEEAGIHIPRFCYHPGLSVAGNCRMCEVEIEGPPKLEPACNTVCRDGMVVHTDNERVRKTRASILELLLIHHPIDCPVCDQAGECKLQDYYMRHGAYKSRFDLEDKLAKPKMVDLGREIMLDNERCVNCTACVRFSAEISGEAELGMFQRGDNSRIGTVGARPLTSRYAGNLVEVCPVGALTNIDFRFRRRVWFLTSTDSVCDGCARGCSIRVDHDVSHAYKKSSDRVFRYRARYNPRVNDYWICDAGRYSYKRIDARDRIAHPQLRDGTTLDWSAALDRIMAALGAAARVDVILSTDRTCEEMHAALSVLGPLARTIEGRVSGAGMGESDDYLRLEDHTPNRRGALELGLPAEANANESEIEGILDRAARGETDLLLVLGVDLTSGDLDNEVVQRAMAGATLSVYSGSRPGGTGRLADLLLPRAMFAEQSGTFVNADGLIQRIRTCVEPLGEARPEWSWLDDLALRLRAEPGPPDDSGRFARIADRFPFFSGLGLETISPLGTPGRGIEMPETPVAPGLRQPSKEEALR
ncbi:MAG: hypothetical protein CME06_00085 [Gemmatimonadetes bacterium]|nr:hypothetical protein [Gemmatimonadota bacterium]